MIASFYCPSLSGDGDCTLESPHWSSPCVACPRWGSEISAAAAIEAAAELRAANRSRCVYRSIEPLRHEPCVCPVIASLPIYRCDCPDLSEISDLKSQISGMVECSDLRQPHPPAKFCGDCPHKSRE